MMCKETSCKCKCKNDDGLPPDWAFKRVCEVTGWAPVTKKIMDSNPELYEGRIALARYIAQHEEPPVDPDLLIAREAFSSLAVTPHIKEGYLSGKYDKSYGVTTSLEVLKLFKERNNIS